jgi:hypothetical protein
MTVERLEIGDQAMYVQVARRTRCDGASLTLVDLAPSTVYLVDQPTAAVGHLPTGQFLDQWYSESAGLATRAVPAVLSLLDADRDPRSDIRVLLSLPRIRDAGLEYHVRILEGDIPPASGACVLFIQPPVPPAPLRVPA